MELRTGTSHQSVFVRVVIYGILALLGLGVVLPMLVFSSFRSAVGEFLMFGPARIETSRGAIGVSPGGIVSKAMPDSRLSQIVSLADLSAEPFEARGTVRRLRFVGVQFRDSKDRMTNPADRKARPMVLDMNLPKDVAVVLVADEPIAWALNNRGARERARIGFEGIAPSTIRAEPGTVSGFRIGAFGSTHSARPVELTDETPASLKLFCDSMMVWGNHFAIDIHRMEYTLLSNPSSLTLTAESSLPAGQSGVHYSGSTLRTLCFGPPRTNRNTQGKPIYNRVSRQWN